MDWFPFEESLKKPFQSTKKGFKSNFNREICGSSKNGSQKGNDSRDLGIPKEGIIGMKPAKGILTILELGRLNCMCFS